MQTLVPRRIEVDENTADYIMTSVKKKLNPMAELLNKVEAMIKSKAATLKELGLELLPEKKANAQYARAHEWICQRKYPISNGDVMFRLMDFAAKKTLEIADSKELSSAYRKAFKEVSRCREN